MTLTHIWEKLALLHFQDFDSSQLRAEPRLLKVLNGFPSIGAMRQGWRLSRNDILPAAFRMLCNINDEYVASANIPPTSMWFLKTWCCAVPTGETALSLTDLPFVGDLFARLLLQLFSRAGVLLHLPLTLTSSPSICTDIQNSLKFRPFESVPLDILVSLDGLSIRKALKVAAVQFRGAITRWACICTSWENRLILDNCVAYAWTPSWHLAVPICALCGYSCGRRQRLPLPLQHAKCTVVASSQLVINNVHDAITDCDAILTTLKSLLAKVSG